MYATSPNLSCSKCRLHIGCSFRFCPSKDRDYASLPMICSSCCDCTTAERLENAVSVQHKYIESLILSLGLCPRKLPQTSGCTNLRRHRLDWLQPRRFVGRAPARIQGKRHRRGQGCPVERGMGNRIQLFP